MRSTAHKQNSPPTRTSLIARYCLAAVVLLALLGPLAEIARGDFILQDDEQLTVSSPHGQGILFDRSRASITSAGSVYNLKMYDFSTVDISGGSVDSLLGYGSSTVNFSAGNLGSDYAELRTFDTSTVNISGGSVRGSLYAKNSSAVNISGGSVNISLWAYDSSAVTISSGSVRNLYAKNSSTPTISGGSVVYLVAYGSSALAMSAGSVTALNASDWSTVNISGGSVTTLSAWNSSAVAISGGSITNLDTWNSGAVTFYGQNFRVGGELAFDGERVLGTGTLSGEWMDGTRWAVNITHSDLTATILAIPESAHRPFCVKYPVMDFNGDCKVDFSDLAVFLTHWLDCNLDPPSACWE